jgi:hypothetical protein
VDIILYSTANPPERLDNQTILKNPLTCSDKIVLNYLTVPPPTPITPTVTNPVTKPAVSSTAKPVVKNPPGFCTDINKCLTATCKTVKDCTKLVKTATTKSMVITLTS